MQSNNFTMTKNELKNMLGFKTPKTIVMSHITKETKQCTQKSQNAESVRSISSDR